jgi:hypothetical protein
MNDQAPDTTAKRWRPSPKERARWRAEHAALRLAQAREPISDVHRAHEFLAEHPVRGGFDSSFLTALSFDYVKVDPLAEEIDDDPARNTATRVWLECGPGVTAPDERGEFGGVTTHDPALDCGGLDFESALIQLAVNVRARYGPPLAEGLSDVMAPSMDPAWGRDDDALE